MLRTTWFELGVDGPARDLTDAEAQRLILGWELTDTPSYRIEEQIDDYAVHEGTTCGRERARDNETNSLASSDEGDRLVQGRSPQEYVASRSIDPTSLDMISPSKPGDSGAIRRRNRRIRYPLQGRRLRLGHRQHFELTEPLCS